MNNFVRTFLDTSGKISLEYKSKSWISGSSETCSVFQFITYCSYLVSNSIYKDPDSHHSILTVGLKKKKKVWCTEISTILGFIKEQRTQGEQCRWDSSDVYTNTGRHSLPGTETHEKKPPWEQSHCSRKTWTRLTNSWRLSVDRFEN